MMHNIKGKTKMKQYKTKTENRINKDFVIPSGSMVNIDWNGMDGANWEYTDDKGVTYIGCPWIDTDMEEVKE
jgi:hypothetical protein